MADSEYQLELIPVYFYVGITMFISILGNGVTCFIFGYKLRQTVTRNFIFTLAMLDLVSSLICMPSEVYFLATITSFHNPELCKFFRYITYVFHSSTSLILLAIAWDRFYKVCRPLKVFFNVRRSRWYCACSIGASVFIAGPSILLYGTKTLPDHHGTTCSVDDEMEPTVWPFIFYFTYAMFFAAIAVAMVVLYSFVIKEVRKLKKNHETRKSRVKDELKLNKYADDQSKNSRESCEADDKAQDEPKPTKYSPLIQSSQSDSGILVPHNDGQTKKIAIVIPKISVQDFGPELPNESTPKVPLVINGKAVHHLQIHNKHVDNLRAEEASFESEITSGHGTLTDSDDERNEEQTIPRESTLRKVFTKKRDKWSDEKPEVKPEMKPSYKRQRSIAYKPGKTTRMLLAVTLCFVFSFLPFFIVVIIRSHLKDAFYTSMNDFQSVLTSIFIRSYLVSNAVNPIIYGILNTHFRQEVTKLMRGKCAKSHSKRRFTFKMSSECIAEREK
ncbi:hypothetical protein LOTGIDRAFT_166315 [Lottia gigantea]|uniref:G-protein coupled receptors family 1 profile domain-containing protein n=1 Tax=Lottia gigantea TaxID=225164 RepID=V3Z9U3_LOTGI|nr:hypothetical protein LOTGIDRAFT_166315 [Lottia gigantea]ESO87728.1 hypothetical protein LOTGIDRAFT_166315 [Lottia gigantea]